MNGEVVARLLNPTGDEKLDFECRAEAAALISSLVAERDAWRQHCSNAEEMWTQYQDGLYAENGRRHKAEDKLVECHEMICALGARALTAERLLAEAVEQAFRDGLAYGGNVENADPDVAWQHSKARDNLSTGGVNG